MPPEQALGGKVTPQAEARAGPIEPSKIAAAALECKVVNDLDPGDGGVERVGTEQVRAHQCAPSTRAPQ